MRQTDFIAGQGGEVVKYDPNVHAPKAPAKPLTRHQRATLYFKVVRYVGSLFKEVGFRPITQDTHSSFTMELGSFILEMTVQEPSSVPMAYVTSHRDYAYDSKKINAKIEKMSVGAEPGEYVIRLTAMLPNMRSTKPMYVIVSKDSPDPLKEAFMSALTCAKELIGRDPATLGKIQAAMSSRNFSADFEKLKAEDEKQLPGHSGDITPSINC